MGARSNKLADRLSPAALAKRQARIDARKTVATDLMDKHNQVARLAVSTAVVLRRGFFGRLKWLLIGR